MIPRFRAWHKDLKMMLPILQLDFLYKRLLVEALDSKQYIAGHGYFWDLKDTALMQWTYNYDKNKKELYVGDIVRLGEQDTFYLSMYREAYILSWAQGDFIHNDRMLADFKSSEIELLGNIYENGSLLKCQ